MKNETERIMNIKRITRAIGVGLDTIRGNRPGPRTIEEADRVSDNALRSQNITDPNEILIVRFLMYKFCQIEMPPYNASPLKKRLRETNTLPKKSRIEANCSTLVQALLSTRYRGHIRHILRFFCHGDIQQADPNEVPRVDTMTDEVIPPTSITFKLSPRNRNGSSIYLSENSFKSLGRLKEVLEPFGGCLSV